jgi:N-acetylglucosaminyl-diphospho-decaprenol L-rhamnosyltransferase
MSFITAIVVAFDSAHALPDCLGALREAGVPTIVIDNASEDGSAAIAADHGATVIRNARNEGYGRANNIGAGAAESEFLLVVNPDVVIEPGTVAALLEAARRYPECGFFAPQIVEPSGRVFFQPRSLLAPYLRNPKGTLVIPEGDACVPFASGACFLVRRNLFLRLGGFDEHIVLFYEDDDLCRRVADASPALIYVPEAVVRHGRGQSSAARSGRVFKSRWHQAWSRAYICRKYHLPNPAPSMFAVNALKALGASLLFRRPLLERYGGSAAGAWAFLRGKTALVREGLEPRVGVDDVDQEASGTLDEPV